MKLELKIIVGLGNPDPKYENTYHNVGFLFLDFLGKGVKSGVYMNESGKFVAKEIKKAGTKPGELLLAHDDSDIALGNYKFSFGRGAAGHHGVESVQATLKTKDFWRLRIGIRPPQKEGEERMKALDFVLKKISPADKAVLEKVFAEIAEKLK